MQSHTEQVRRSGESGTPALYARRAAMRAAVFGTRDHDLRARRPAGAAAASVAAGVITAVREDAIAVDSGRGTELFDVSPATVTWLGTHASPSVLRSGDPVIVRHRAPDAATSARRHAERIWARIGPVPLPIGGSAVWHEPGGEPPGLLGLGYPAIDPEERAQPAGGGTGCVRLVHQSATDV